MAAPAEYWDVTINTLQPLIAKPTLKAPLLQKPPFRFLHDIVTGLMASTGFPNGLFDEAMISSENAKSFDKDQKIQFLNRLIIAVQLAIGQVIDVSPSKIIAGLEPEKTNALLQGLADAGRAAPNLDMPALIAAVDAGQVPDGKTSFNKNQRAAAAPAAAAPAPAAARPQRAPQQSSSSSSAAPSGALRPTRPPIQLPAGEGGEDFVATTTRLIGSLIQKPKMTDKLLRKPPFRFLHDIVTAVMAATTYPEGYFSPEELDSAAFAETNQKLAFLQKFIDLVGATNSVDLSQVNPKKIAAGLEPEQTNVLLQQFAYAAASGISARDVAAKLASSAPPAAAAASAAVDNSAAEAEAAAAAERKARAAAEAEARKQAALAESQRQQAAAAAAAAQQQASQPKAMPKLGLGGIDPNEESKDDDAQVRNKIERPKTARKAPPKLASNLIEEKKSNANDEKKSAENALGGGAVIAEGEVPQEDNDDDEEEEKVNLDNGAEVLSGFGDDGNDGADGMVVKAMKNKLKDAAAANDGTMKIRSSASVAGGMSQAQLDDLRKQIQLLCQSVNPLGKCIDFVREDIDSMNKELSRWRVAYTEYTDELEVERKSTERIVEPLQQSLADVEQQIAEQQRKIHAIKSSILRNDSQIAQLLDTKTAVQQ